MKLIDNASGNVSQGITLSSENKADRYKLSYNCSNIGNGKSYIRIYATVIEGYKTYFMPVQFSGNVTFEFSIDNEATFLQFEVIGDATITGITLETVVDATLEYVKENIGYWDRVKEFTDSTGKVRSDMLVGLINTAINAFTNTSGTITTVDGVTTYLNGSTIANSTEAMQLTGGAIRIADKKDASGNWVWDTAMTGKGINANLIVAGVLNAIDIMGSTITGGSIIGGSIVGVTIEGSTIYAGNRETGDYTRIDSGGNITGYVDGKQSFALRRSTEGHLELSNPFTSSGSGYVGLGINPMGGASNGSNGATITPNNPNNLLIIRGNILVDGNIQYKGSLSRL